MIVLLKWELMQGYLILGVRKPFPVMAKQEWDSSPFQNGTEERSAEQAITGGLASVRDG
jgi:hypothetical protein